MSANAVSIAGVTKQFNGTVALDGIDLEVPEGSVVALLGPNGAGKTTIVRVLATLLRPDTGTARVFGHDVAKHPERVRELIGLTGQFAAIDELLTGQENLEMFGRLFHLSPGAARRRAGELLEQFDLGDAADRPARTYSGGMRRRLDLASSLLTRPKMLFLDEPTTGLDPRSRNQIWAELRELVAAGTTLLLTTQYLEEAEQLADRITVIDHGRAIAEGTGDQLKDLVGGRFLQVSLIRAADREEAVKALSEVGCSAPQPSERPDRLTLSIGDDGLTTVSRAAAALEAAGIDVSDMALRRPTLDDVFMDLTGAPPGNGRPFTKGADLRRAQPESATAETSDAPQEPARPRLDPLRVRRTVSDAGVVTVRNIRHFLRQPGLLLFSTVQPIMFVLLFAFVFSGAIGQALPEGIDYIDFLLPGIFIQSVSFRATQTAIGLAEDLERGVIDRFRSMPMARSAVLAGRTIADLVRNLVILAIMIVVGYAIGFRFQRGVLSAMAAIAVVLAFAFALSWIFASLALWVKGVEAVQSAGFLAIFPFVFASSIFVPLETMPGWLERIAAASPVSLSADTARALSIGGDLGSFPAAMTWVAGLLAVFIPLCVWRYRKIG
ncbi:MAG: ATP-binding cassette domain-containing protein [Actinomycetota bacterium]